MTLLQREALQMCLEYIETDAHERRHVRWKINEALAEQPAQQEPTQYQELREVLKDLMDWQVKNVKVWHNNAYDNAQHVLDRHAAAPQPAQQEPVNQRAHETALRQWDSWKTYALELQEKLVKYEGGAPMVLNTSPQPAQQEPVGRLESDPDEGHVFVPRIEGDWSMLGEDLYTSPQPAQQEPVAYLYASIAGPVVLHRVKPIGMAKACFVQAQLENDIKAAEQYPNAHSCIPLYTSPQPAPVQQEPEYKYCDDGKVILKNPEMLSQLLREQPAQQEPVATLYGSLPVYDKPAQQEIPDLIAREFGVSRGTAYDMMREALAEQPAPVQQEPFGYLYEGTAEHTRHKTLFEKTRAERFETRWWREIGPCYTSPPAQRTWVGLTDEERQACINYRAVEAKLKEKNT